ncbi:hypothetical protein SUGI_0804860 [Cryptomeria japonica]|nr:hypothetical protein SUGI_0804860 [Cryptomeria japonica]
MSNGRVSESQRIHSDELSQLGATEPQNESDVPSNLYRQGENTILAKESLQQQNSKNYLKTSCPSPYYFGGGMPSVDYMTNSKAYYANAFTPGRESISSNETIRSYRDTLFRRNCFFLPADDEENLAVDTQSEPAKQVHPKFKLTKELSKSFADVHMRVGRFLWRPMRRRFMQKNRHHQNGKRKEIVDPVQHLREKVEESDVRFQWAERWRPERLSDLILNKPQARELEKLVKQRDCPHMIFEGPPGVGKTSLIRAMIAGIFKGEDEPVRKRTLIIKLKAELETKIAVPLVGNSNYTEISFNSLGGYERNVIDNLINTGLKNNSDESIVEYKVIAIREADKLSTDTQYYIRWMMERHSACCKLIFCCSNASKLEPISSLCKIIHVDPPTTEQMIQVLQRIARKENINLSQDFAKRIAESSDRNLCQAIRSLEACKRSQYPFTDNQKILTGWEDVIAKIAKSIVEEQSPKQLYNIRAKLQKLIMHNLNPNFVFSTLVEELRTHLDDNMKRRLMSLYATYNGNKDNDEDRLTGNQRESYVLDSKKNANRYIQIEEFTAKFMSIYKAGMNETS